MAGFAVFWGLLPTFISEWGLTNIEAGAVNGILFFGYLAAVPILVSLTDRMDPKRIYILFDGPNRLIQPRLRAYGGGFWTAALFRLIAGIGLAGTYMPGLKLLSDRLQGPAQSRAIAFYTGGFSIGSALSFFLAGELAPLSAGNGLSPSPPSAPWRRWRLLV